MRVAMTDRFVARATAPDKGQREFFDTRATGLSLRLSQGGARAWCFHYSDNGHRRRATLGSYPAMSLADARAAAVEAKGNVSRGEPIIPARGDNVAALVEGYVEKHVATLRSAAQIESRLRNNVLPLIGHVPIANLHRRDINRVVDAVLARGTPRQAVHVFSDLKSMLGWALRRGDVDRDVTAGMVRPAPARSRDRSLSADEIATLWSVLPVALAKSTDAQRILRLCLITGQRVGEVTGMMGSELDLPAREWRLPPARTKNAHPHVVPLSDMALAEIKAALGGTGERDALFDITSKRVSRLADEIQGAVGIPHWTTHDLRRSAITLMAGLGVAPIVLGHIANHRTTTKAGITLAVYSQHAYGEEKRTALDLWADRLTAIVSGQTTAKVLPLRGRAGA
jgi:integrase